MNELRTTKSSHIIRVKKALLQLAEQCLRSDEKGYISEAGILKVRNSLNAELELA